MLKTRSTIANLVVPYVHLYDIRYGLLFGTDEISCRSNGYSGILSNGLVEMHFSGCS